MANQKEIEKRIKLLYEEAAAQQKIFENDKRRTTALKESQKAMDKIFQLEKELPKLSKQQEKVLSKSSKLSKEAGKEMEKQSGFMNNMFGIGSKSAAVQKAAVENIGTIVESNEDLSSLGDDQLSKIDMINKGYYSQADLAAEVEDLEGKIADETGEVSDGQKDIYQQTLDVAKQKQKTVGLMGKMGKASAGIAGNMAKMAASIVSAGAAFAFLQKAIMKANEISGSVGKEFGAIGMNAEGFSDRIDKTAGKMIGIGLSATDLNSSIATLTSEFGININQLDEMGQGVESIAYNIANSGKAMGLNTAEATNLYGMFMQITDTTQQQAEQMLEQTASLAMMSGVAPQQVMKDIANSGEIFAAHMKDGGANVLEAAIRARQLGLSLDKVAKIGDTLMNFQSSLNAEMEAGIMIGKQINLQKAREAYLAGDLVGMQDEILKQIGSEQEFNKMNILQKQSLAKAVGMNVQELQKMMSAEEEMTELMGEIEETNPLKDLIGEEAMTEIDELMARIEKLTADIGTELLPVIESFVSLLNGLMQNMNMTNTTALVLAGTFTAMVGPAIAAAVSAIATAMGLHAAAVPIVGWIAAGIAGTVMYNQIKGMMAEAKSVKDMVGSPKGPVVSMPDGKAYQGLANDTAILTTQPELLGGGGQNMKPVERGINRMIEKMDMLIKRTEEGNKNTAESAEGLEQLNATIEFG